MADAAILFLRRSDAKQEASLKKQLKWAITRAKELGITLAATQELLEKMMESGEVEHGDLYLDDAIAGANMLRPGLKAFRNRALHGNGFTHIMALARDRLARPDEPAEVLTFENAVRKRGITIVFEKKLLLPLGPNDYDIGENVSGLIDYDGARQFAVKLSRHAARAHKANAQDGLSSGGRPPHGFIRALVRMSDLVVQMVLPDGTRSPRTKGQKVVFLPGTHPKVEGFLSKDEYKRYYKDLAAAKLVHKLYHEGVLGLRAIARVLDKRGFTPPTGGRKRKVERWSTSAVKGIIENPIYSGKVGAGRYAEGKYSRVAWHDDSDLRDVEPGELLDLQARKARTVVNRDPSQWMLSAPPIPFEPVVPPEIWQANLELLRFRGTSRGQRGITRHRDPNRYPVRVVCGDCGEPMTGTTVNGERRYKCSTYTKSQGKKCSHNFVPRDVVVWFAVNQIREAVQSASNAAALREAIRAIIKGDQQQQGGAGRLARLKWEIEDAEKRLAVVYKDKVYAKDDETRKTAAGAYGDFLKDLQALKHEASEIESQQSFQKTGNIEEEVEKTLAVLGQLHLFLGRVRDSQLRGTFDALGVRAMIHFEHKKGKKNVSSKPCRIELQIGANGKVTPPEGATKAGESDGTGKADSAATAGKGQDLCKGGGGERIRTAV